MSEPKAPSLMPDLWSSCMEQLALQIPQQQFNTWIKPLQVRLDGDADRLILLVANRFKLDWIRAQYSQQIQSLVNQLSPHAVHLELAITPKESPAKSKPINQDLAPLT